MHLYDPAVVVLLLLGATPAEANCPGAHPAVTRVTLDDGPVLAVVPDDSPLFVRPLLLPDRIEVRPVDAVTLSTAAVQLGAGRLTCGATVTVSAAMIRSPIDRSDLFEPVWLPTLAPERGFTEPGPERTDRLARSHDATSWKGPPTLPVRADPATVIAVEGGATAVIRLHSPAYGVVGWVYGPVVRLGASGAVAPSARRVDDDGSFFVGRGAAARVALDDRDGALRPGDVVTVSDPTIIRMYGALERPVALPDVTLHDPGSDLARIAVAHGTAAILPLLSSTLSLLANPKCVALCGDPELPGERAFVARFRQRSIDDIDRSRDRLTIFEWATVGTALLTTLIPTNRRGVLSRFEILEDALIIGEAVMITWTTPLFLQARIGRRRPVSYHPGFDVDGRAAVAPSFVAYRSNRAAAMLGASMMMLIVEDAGIGWVVGATTVLGGLLAGVAYHEVDSGLVFPLDVPLGIIGGMMNGIGVVLFHEILWRGWPADERGGLPLRLRGIQIDVRDGGGVLSTGLSF